MQDSSSGPMLGMRGLELEPSDGFPLVEIRIGEETGFEIFYNIHLLQGLTLTADLQYIDTGLGSGAGVWTEVGLRLEA